MDPISVSELARVVTVSEAFPVLRRPKRPIISPALKTRHLFAAVMCALTMARLPLDAMSADMVNTPAPSATQPKSSAAQHTPAAPARTAPVPEQVNGRTDTVLAAPAVTRLEDLVAEALRANPEIAAAQRERAAAQARIAPAGALDDPMLEAGIINLPVPSYSFSQEDMTMKMVGVLQRLPYPGKRKLRRDAAEKGAQSVEYAVQETTNRVVRNVKTAYYDLSFVFDATRLVQKNKLILEQFAQLAQARYAVGQASQSDVLKAQTQLSRMLEELIRLGRERAQMEAELKLAIGRPTEPQQLVPAPASLSEAALSLPALSEKGLNDRPQLRALQSTVEQAAKMGDLARKDYYPDFDVRLQYGQRNAMPNGAARDDMVSLTLAINLPIWRETKRDPRVTEATAMQEQALEMLNAQRNELKAQLAQQVAMAEQSYQSARLYETTVLPQARLAVEAALSAYRVNRVDFLTLLDSQMTVFNYEISRAQAVVNYNKALAQIEFVTGAANH